MLWPVNLTTDDKQRVKELASLRRTMRLPATYAATIRAAVDACLTMAEKYPEVLAIIWPEEENGS